MTTTQRKSASTAATVEGTRNPVYNNYITTAQRIQALDKKPRLLSPGIDDDVIIYDFIYNHFLAFCSVATITPSEKVIFFIKSMADCVDEAYLRGRWGMPCIDTSNFDELIEKNGLHCEEYIFFRDKITLAYRQGAEKLPYDYHKSMP